MKSQKIKFKNQNGQYLSAILDLPVKKDPSRFAVFAHCFTCNKNLTAVNNISRALSNEGFGVLRFDFTGLGESEGEFSDTNFSGNIQDLFSATEYLNQEYMAPVLLVGHSLGGAAAIYAGAEIKTIKAIATVGAPSSPVHVEHLFTESKEKIEKEGIAEVFIGGRPFTIKKQFLDDLKSKKMSAVLKEMRKALLIAHSPQDSIVGIVNAAQLYEAAHHPKSFISLDKADHLLSNQDDSLYIGKVISTWADRYLHK